MDKLQGLHPPAPSSGGAAAADEEAARRLHRALNARRGRTRPRPGGEAAEVDEEDGEEEEEVKISLLAVKEEEPEEEDVKIRTLEGVGAGGKRRRLMREREADGAAEAGPSGRGAGGGLQARKGRGKTSRFRGITKAKGREAKPWVSQIRVNEDGKHRQIHIGTFAREEDAARAYDRVSIAKLGHAGAETNFPVAEYRAEWAELEALGVDGAVARERRRARGEL